jgi:hypothetical protein
MSAPTAIRLHRLVYASSASGPLFAEKLDRILFQARHNNARSGLTGIMLFQEGRFLQVLEGARGALLELVERIRRDKRHQNLTILELGPAEARIFPDTPMAWLSARNFTEDQRQALLDALDLAGADAELPADDAMTRKRVAAVLKAFEPVSA